MIQQLEFTSAPRGLVPGSSGYCTVKQTAGISPRLRKMLESISSYRHVYPIHDPLASQNPIEYRHIVAREGTQQLFVLSRICNAGAEHTGRSNFFAAHLVLDSQARLGHSPTLLLTSPAMSTSWDSRVEEVPALTALTSVGTERSRVCSSWQAMAGDAGWGGIVAENVAAGKTTIIAFQPGMDLMPLMSEACALIPESKQWSFTFSSYYKGLADAYDCKVRCVVVGSPEHLAARSMPVSLVDLTQRASVPSESPWVHAARSGVRAEESPTRVAPASPRGTRVRAVGPSQQVGSMENAGPFGKPAETPLQPVGGPPPAPKPGEPPEFRTRASETPPAPPAKPAGKASTIAALAIGMAIGGTASAAALSYLVVTYRNSYRDTVQRIDEAITAHDDILPKNVGDLTPIAKLERIDSTLSEVKRENKITETELKKQRGESAGLRKSSDEKQSQLESERAKAKDLGAKAADAERLKTSIHKLFQDAFADNPEQDTKKIDQAIAIFDKQVPNDDSFLKAHTSVRRIVQGLSNALKTKDELKADVDKLQEQVQGTKATKRTAVRSLGDGPFKDLLPDKAPDANVPPQVIPLAIFEKSPPIHVRAEFGGPSPSPFQVTGKSGTRSYHLWWKKLRLYTIEFTKTEEVVRGELRWDPSLALQNFDNVFFKQQPELQADWKRLHLFGFFEGGVLGEFTELKPRSKQNIETAGGGAGQ